MTPAGVAEGMNKFSAGWVGNYVDNTIGTLRGLGSTGPFVARIGGNPGHFVIVDRVTASRVFIRDPAGGLGYSKSIDNFLDILSGAVYRLK